MSKHPNQLLLEHFYTCFQNKDYAGMQACYTDDATFSDEEFDNYRGFGHSTWQQGVRLAQAANARQVGLIHHATWRTDTELTRIERLARREFAGAFCGRELQIIDV